MGLGGLGWGIWWLLLWWCGCGARARLRRRRVEASPAPFLCPKGRLAHVPCTCTAAFVRCVNTQLRDAEIFQDIATRFPRIREISVAGNSLMGLRFPIFSTPDQKDLRHLHKLLIPNNYLVELHPSVFRFAPALHTLDLSFNEIKLAPQRRGFLAPLTRLRHLILRKGFSRPLKYDLLSTSRQLSQLELEFQAANLTELFDVDLSINFIRYIPFGFGCSLSGVLRRLNLEGNELETLSPGNMSCLYELDWLNLGRNILGALAPRTRLTLAAFNADVVLLAENKLLCDCRAKEAVAWLRHNASSVADSSELRCSQWSQRRRSPAGGALALSLPDTAFVCSAAPPLLQSLGQPINILHVILLLLLLQAL